MTLTDIDDSRMPRELTVPSNLGFSMRNVENRNFFLFKDTFSKSSTLKKDFEVEICLFFLFAKASLYNLVDRSECRLSLPYVRRTLSVHIKDSVWTCECSSFVRVNDPVRTYE